MRKTWRLVRYFGELKIPIPKASAPSADDLLNMIAEVLTAQPNDNQDAGTPQQSPSMAAVPEQPADTSPVPPKTIALGQTIEQVVAAFGQPQKVANLGDKAIFYYPDMKVTFFRGKVTDVQ